jgi:hypothetical protein
LDVRLFFKPVFFRLKFISILNVKKKTKGFEKTSHRVEHRVAQTKERRSSVEEKKHS